MCRKHPLTIVILVCVVREKDEDKTRNDKSGSEGSKSDSGDEGKVEDIVDETGMAPATTPMHENEV